MKKAGKYNTVIFLDVYFLWLDSMLYEWSYNMIAVTSIKQSWKFSGTFAGNRSPVAPVQDQCSNHWAKESLTQLSELDYILEAMQNLQLVDI